MAPPSCALPAWRRPLALVVLAWGVAACSSNGRKDQSYGKDVGIVYEPPEGGTVAADGSASDGGVSDARAGADGGADGGDAVADDAS